VKILITVPLILSLFVPAVATAHVRTTKTPSSRAVPARRVAAKQAKRGDSHPRKRRAASGPLKGRVMITGSRIPRKPGTLLASPVITLKRRQIRLNGHTTLCGALRDVAQATVIGCP
jgi:hypothetical protein